LRLPGKKLFLLKELFSRSGEYFDYAFRIAEEELN